MNNLRVRVLPFLALPALLFLVTACETPRSHTSGPASSTTATTATGEGSSFATAIVIKAKNESEGVPQEYEWLRNHLPLRSVVSQALTFEGKKAYDVLTVALEDGTQRKVYFDISGFFGKL